jgi:hypothetical protein
MMPATRGAFTAADADVSAHGGTCIAVVAGRRGGLLALARGIGLEIPVGRAE